MSRALPVIEPERQKSIHRAVKPSLIAQSDRLKLRTPTKANPLIVSVSELRDFMRCRVRWHWRHQARLEPTGGSVNLSVGSLTHLILETWYKRSEKNRTTKSMEAVAKELIKATTLKALDTESRELTFAMAVGYANWTLDPVNPMGDIGLGYHTGMPEEWFEIPLNDAKTILLRGKYDNRFVPSSMKRTLGLYEFKTASQIKMSKFDYNLQLGGYATAMRHDHGKQFKRVVIFPTVLRKQMPGPRVRADLFAREMIELTREECEMWRADAGRAALDMLDAAVYPNPSDACEWDCDFRSPCMLRGTPSDTKHVLKTEYQPKEWRA